MYNIRAQVIFKKQKTNMGKRQVANPSKKDIRKSGRKPPTQKKVFAKEASSHHGHKKVFGEKRASSHSD